MPITALTAFEVSKRIQAFPESRAWKNFSNTRSIDSNYRDMWMLGVSLKRKAGWPGLDGIQCTSGPECKGVVSRL